MTIQLRYWHIIVPALYLLLLATAQAANVKVSTQPPPRHTCGDVYRSRDYGSLFGVLYVPDDYTSASVCLASPDTPPPRPQPRRLR